MVFPGPYLVHDQCWSQQFLILEFFHLKSIIKVMKTSEISMWNTWTWSKRSHTLIMFLWFRDSLVPHLTDGLCDDSETERWFGSNCSPDSLHPFLLICVSSLCLYSSSLSLCQHVSIAVCQQDHTQIWWRGGKRAEKRIYYILRQIHYFSFCNTRFWHDHWFPIK